MKNYFVNPQRENNRCKINSYINLGLDQNGKPIHIQCPKRFTFLEVSEDDNKTKLLSSENMRGWIIMLSGQISCPPAIANQIQIIAKGEKEIIGVRTPVLLLSTELENFFLRVKRKKGHPAHILRFFEYNHSNVPYNEVGSYNLKLHNSTEYCNGDLIKL
jgi:hypothetical protein